MNLPRFLDRVVDAAAPILGGLEREAVRERLDESSIGLIAGDGAAEGVRRAGFLFAANLAARLYPHIRLLGPAELLSAAESEIRLINPRADIGFGNDACKGILAYETLADGPAGVSVFTRGWNVLVDNTVEYDAPAAAPAALAAAALGMGELFRIIFAEELDERGRRERQPGSFNLVTLGEPRHDLPIPDSLHVSPFRIIGLGAIGEAAAQTLAVSGVRGQMLAVDPEKVSLSNLQRYMLTRDTDVGAVKADLLRDRLGNSRLEIVPLVAEWHAGLADEQQPTLVALDSAEARLGVQASLPGTIYNAWTQPADVGWSRHERFGEDPCLACLYWPDRRGPSRYDQIAAAFRQHPLRVLAYLVRRLPIGLPLPEGGIPAVPGFSVPTDAQHWLERPLADDIAAAAGINPSELAPWHDRILADVYQDGICGGGLLHLNIGDIPQDVVVPLAHQSALAGIMLAKEFIVSQVPDLTAVRPLAQEGRYDVLIGLPQVLTRPRVRTRGCLCEDPVFVAAYLDRVGRGIEEPMREAAHGRGDADGRH